MPTSNIFLQLDFKQLFDLARQLPVNERLQLADMLLKEETNVGISDAQKQLVRSRIKKYNEHPELLIEEEKAMELINNM